MSKKTIILKIESEAFDALREDFNKALENLLSQMQEKRSEEAEISVKIELQLNETQVPDELSTIGMPRDAVIPSIKHKVVSKMTNKDERAGLCIQPNAYELMWDQSIHKYVLRGLESDQQTLFADDDDTLLDDLHDLEKNL